jgi:hypothetical protein
MKTLDQLDAKLEKRIPISSIPIDISKAGSYYLTQNLLGAPGINVTVSGVTIDLNGFSVVGLGKNASTPGSGIVGLNDTTVRNGRVSDFVGDGIHLGAAGVVENVDVANIGGICISAGEQSRVERCRVGSGQQGIVVGDSSVVESCQSIANSGSDNVATGRGGIRTGSFSTVSNCVSSYNSGLGIGTLNNCVVSHCVTSHNNTFAAISVGDSCKLLNCVASYNSTNSNTGTASGFNTGVSCLIEGSIASFNHGGAFVHSDTVVRSSTFSANYEGLTLGGDRCKVIDCAFTANVNPGGSAINSNGTGNLIDGNHIRGNAGNGITAGVNSKAVIIRNEAGGNNGSGGSYGGIGSGNNTGPVVAPENATSPFSNLLN